MFTVDLVEKASPFVHDSSLTLRASPFTCNGREKLSEGEVVSINLNQSYHVEQILTNIQASFFFFFELSVYFVLLHTGQGIWFSICNSILGER